MKLEMHRFSRRPARDRAGLASEVSSECFTTRGPTGGDFKYFEMKLERFSRIVTEHTLSRKVEHLESRTFLMMVMFIDDVFHRYGNCQKTRACMIRKCSSCEFENHLIRPDCSIGFALSSRILP